MIFLTIFSSINDFGHLYNLKVIGVSVKFKRQEMFILLQWASVEWRLSITLWDLLESLEFENEGLMNKYLFIQLLKAKLFKIYLLIIWEGSKGDKDLKCQKHHIIEE